MTFPSQTRCYAWGCQDRSVPRELLELFSIVSFKEVPEVVGSFSYPDKHRYPGDIDVFEQTVFVTSSANTASKIYSNWFSTMARRIMAYSRSASERKDIFMTDFKAGTTFKGNANEKIRWSLKELSQQFATRNGCNYYLSDALKEGTVVKGDYVTNYNGRLVSVEFFYHLQYKINNDANLISLSSIGKHTYRDSVIKDFRKYSNPQSPDYKPLKALKRLWIISIINNDPYLANRISTIFDSNSAALHQAKETIVLTILLLRKQDVCKIPVDQIVQNALATVKTTFNHGDTYVYSHIDCLLDKLWNIYRTHTARERHGERRISKIDDMITILNELESFLAKLTIEDPTMLLAEIVQDFDDRVVAAT